MKSSDLLAVGSSCCKLQVDKDLKKILWRFLLIFLWIVLCKNPEVVVLGRFNTLGTFTHISVIWRVSVFLLYFLFTLRIFLQSGFYKICYKYYQYILMQSPFVELQFLLTLKFIWNLDLNVLNKNSSFKSTWQKIHWNDCVTTF